MFKKKYNKKMILSLITTLLIYTLVFWIILVSYEVYSEFLPIKLVHWIDLRKDLIVMAFLIIGYIVVFFVFWNKLLSYIEEIEQAMSNASKKDGSVVKLSEPLKDIEEKMNSIKMNILLADEAIKISENKKKELIAYLAHDLRTPLTSIIGYLSMLHETPELSEDKREKYIMVLLNKAKHMEVLINDFFEITQYTTGHMSIKKDEINLYYMIVQISDEFAPMCLINNNTIRIDIDENFRVNLDSEKMARVFENLLKNAISYSYPDTEISISVQKNEGKFEIIFKNKGKTLTKDEIGIMFEKFERLNPSRNSEVSGAGLGLSIVKEIVELHGGTVELSSYDEMIIFRIKLPVF